MAPRKPKAKAGGLTRDQRAKALRKTGDYGAVRLIPGGTPITCRKSDGRIHLGEIEQAGFEFAGTGKRKRLSDWLRLKSTRELLADIAGDIDPTWRNPEVEPTDLVAFLIDRGAGKEPWGHHELAAAFAGWISVPLQRQINRLWMETVNGKKRPKADPLLTSQRRATQRPFTDVLAAKGMDGAGIQRCQRQLVFEVTGKAPNVWREELGPNWMDLMPEEFQVTMAIARRFAAEQCEQLDLSEAEGFFRHFNAAFRRAAAPVKQLQPYLAEIAANCDAAKALMLGTRETSNG
jgi:hypothetical protein